MPDDDQFTIVRDGVIYHTDRRTIDLLTAAQQYDASQTTAHLSVSRFEPRMQDTAFEHAAAAGRIQKGPVHIETHDQSQAHSHGHRR